MPPWELAGGFLAIDSDGLIIPARPKGWGTFGVGILVSDVGFLGITSGTRFSLGR